MVSWILLNKNYDFKIVIQQFPQMLLGTFPAQIWSAAVVSPHLLGIWIWKRKMQVILQAVILKGYSHDILMAFLWFYHIV
jgi:hypothetical protein